MTTDSQQFRTLEDIEAQKQLLSEKIVKKEERLRTRWQALFHKTEARTPSSRLMRTISITSGIFDGALLGWKLYRRFKR